MSVKNYNWIYGIKSESPEDFPVDILKAYLENNNDRWSASDDASEETKKTVEKANKRADDEKLALEKAIEKLEAKKDVELNVEIEKLKDVINDKEHIISALTHLFKELMDIDYDADMFAEVYEMPRDVSAQSNVRISWTAKSLFTHEIKRIMELRPDCDCCDEAEDGVPKVDFRINTSYFDDKDFEPKPYVGKFEVELGIYFSKDDWEKVKQK